MWLLQRIADLILEARVFHINILEYYQGIIIAYFSKYFWFMMGMMGYYGRVKTLQNTQNANVLSI